MKKEKGTGKKRRRDTKAEREERLLLTEVFNAAAMGIFMHFINKSFARHFGGPLVRSPRPFATLSSGPSPSGIIDAEFVPPKNRKRSGPKVRRIRPKVRRIRPKMRRILKREPK